VLVLIDTVVFITFSLLQVVVVVKGVKYVGSREGSGVLNQSVTKIYVRKVVAQIDTFLMA